MDTAQQSSSQEIGLVGKKFSGKTGALLMLTPAKANSATETTTGNFRKETNLRIARCCVGEYVQGRA
jgi:hypothetical protein